MDTRKVEGETAFYVGMEQPNCDTAWELAGKPFSVSGGSEFVLRIRLSTSLDMLKVVSGHDGSYKMCVCWYDAEGQALSETFAYVFEQCYREWTDYAFEGIIP